MAESREQGFTLIELMVAMGILVVGLTSLLALLTLGVSLRRGTDARHRAVLLADAVLQRVEQESFRLHDDADHALDFTYDELQDQEVTDFPGMRYGVRFVRGPIYKPVLEHLRRSPADFAGAIQKLNSRTRLIQSFAYQSYLWNRAVSSMLEELVPAKQQLKIDSLMGELVTFERLDEAALAELAKLRTPLFAPDGEGGDPLFGGAYLEAGWFLTGEHRPYDTTDGIYDRIAPNRRVTGLYDPPVLYAVEPNPATIPTARSAMSNRPLFVNPPMASSGAASGAERT